MNIKEQLNLVAKQLETQCNVKAEVQANSDILLIKEDKQLLCELKSTHLQTTNKRDFLFIAHELENNNYLMLELYIEIMGSEVEIFDFKHKDIIKHFEN